MKTLLYVTKLISTADDEAFHIYISLEDFKKYAFIEKNGVLVPKNDKQLLDVLNLVDKKVYDQVVDDDNQSTKNKGNKKLTKEKFRRILAGLGIMVTLLTFEPQILEGVSYVVKRTSISQSADIEADITNDEFIEKFKLSIENNENYTEEERNIVIEGFQNYYNDWGYLLNEVDKEYILSLIEAVTINREASLVDYAAGTYNHWSIELDADTGTDISTLTHETAHAISDRGLLVGAMNGYGQCYALDEGINASINNKYYCQELSYSQQIYDVVKLSLLTNNEVLVKTYQKEGSDYLIKQISNIEGISYTDVLQYLSMMDIELLVFRKNLINKNYELPQSFYEKKDALYSKMFKAKYGYEFSESVLGTSMELANSNFLSDIMYLEREEDIFLRGYEVEKDDLALKADSFNFSDKMVGEFILIDDDYQKRLLVNDPVQTWLELGSWEAFSDYVIGRKALNDEVQQIKTIFKYGVDESNYKLYAKCVVDKALSYDLPADFVACYLRGAIKFKYDFYVDFDSALIDQLKEHGREDVIDLYCNTTISFKDFDFDYPSLYSVGNYYNLRQSDNYIITDDNKLVLHLKEDEYEWDHLIYDGVLMSEYDWSYSTEEVYNELFNCEEGFFWIFDFEKVGIDNVDRDAIDLKIRLYPEVNPYSKGADIGISK